MPITTVASGAVREHDRLNVVEDPTARGVSIALWLGFAGLISRALFNESEILRPLGRLLIHSEGILLIILGVRALHDGLPIGSRSAARWIFAVVYLAVLDALLGLVYRAEWTYWIEQGILPFFGVFAVYLGMRPGMGERIRRVCLWQVIIAAALGMYIIALNPPLIRAEWFGEIRDAPASIASRSLYAVPFLLGLWHHLPLWQLCGVLLAYTVQVHLAIIGQARGLALIYLVVIPILAMIGAWRSGLTWGRILRKAGVLVLGMALLLAATWQVVDSFQGSGWMAGALEKTVSRTANYRLYSEGTVGEFFLGLYEVIVFEYSLTRPGIGRGTEAEDFLEGIGLSDYLFGRGFGATYSSRIFGMDFPIVHTGPLNLILHGGLPLAVVFLGFLATGIAHAWRNAAGCQGAAGALLYCIVYLIGFMGYGVPASDPPMYMLWLCVGMAFSGIQKPSTAAQGQDPVMDSTTERHCSAT